MYAQALSTNIREVLKIKDNFLNLSNKKIEELYNSLNKSNKLKPYINIMTKDPLCKQIIVPMSSDNSRKFMISFGKYIANLNCTLKKLKLDIIVDFIWVDYRSLIITTNKVTFSSNISVVGNYIKNINNIDSNNMQNAYLS